MTPSRQPSGGGPRVPGLAVLAAVLLIVGLPPTLALLGVPGLGALEPRWSALFGGLADPIALGLVASAVLLLRVRHSDPWRLPWARILAAELLVLAILALLAFWADAGGWVGWTLARWSGEAVGSAGAIVGWALVGVLAMLLIVPRGTNRVARWFRAVADALDEPARDRSQGMDQGGGREIRNDATDNLGPRRARSGAESLGDEGSSPDWSGRSDGARRPAIGRAGGTMRPSDDRVAATEHPAAYAGGEHPGSTGTLAEGRDRPTGTDRSGAAGVSEPEPTTSDTTLTRPPGGWPTGAGGPAASAPEMESSDAGRDPSDGTKGDRAEEAKFPPKLRIAKGGGTESRAKRVRRTRALPTLDLLGSDASEEMDAERLRMMAEKIERTLAGFNVPVHVVEVEHGPTVTRFGLKPGTYEKGDRRRRVRVRKITSLKDDLALALSAGSVRIEAPVPGRSIVGLEIPNRETSDVGLSGLLRSARFREIAADSGLALALGRDVSGRPVVGDLTRMPHLLIAGATGSGKSVCLNVLLASLLFQATPDSLRLVLVDPKRVELSQFDELPHLLARVITHVSEVVGALRWVAGEMDRRYKVFAEHGARDLEGYNRRLEAGDDPLPKIVVVIDELADLMLQAPQETEPVLTRLAQLARATGIHLIVATQRPSTDVITGLIKANFPARIAFAVSSGTDSRVILDSTGAESLLGRGDMLFQPPDAPRPRRIQGALVSDEELEKLVGFWRSGAWPAPPRSPPWDDLIPPDDPQEALYDAAIAVALEAGPEGTNASLLQRRLRIGYGKARGLYDRLSEEGILDPDEHDGLPRWTPPNAAPEPPDASRDPEDPAASGSGG